MKLGGGISLTEIRLSKNSPEQSGALREDSTTYGSREFSDYALLGKNGKTLAVVEAKKSSKDAGIGREQAKQYCENIRNNQGGELPFCFYTNGHEIFFWNLGEAPPQKIHVQVTFMGNILGKFGKTQPNETK